MPYEQIDFAKEWEFESLKKRIVELQKEVDRLQQEREKLASKGFSKRVCLDAFRRERLRQRLATVELHEENIRTISYTLPQNFLEILDLKRSK